MMGRERGRDLSSEMDSAGIPIRESPIRQGVYLVKRLLPVLQGLSWREG